MADEKHLEILNRGVEEWNRWRKQNPGIQPDLSSSGLINRDLSRANLNMTDLSRTDLSKAQLSHASLHGANLESSTLILADLLGAILNESNLAGASLFGAFLFGTRLKGANLRGANLMGTSLMGADLSGADLGGAHLMGANFHDANLDRANLHQANLTAASFVGAKIQDAVFSSCSVYGVSAFNLVGSPKEQSNLILTPQGESPITADDLETAQLIYLLISSRKVQDILEKVQSRFVLVLGDFRSRKESVLRSIQASLHQHQYMVIGAQVTPPLSRELTNHVRVLSRFVRFVIADLTEAKAVTQLLSSLENVSILPLVRADSLRDGILESRGEPSPFLKVVAYQNSEDLQSQLLQRLALDFS